MCVSSAEELQNGGFISKKGSGGGRGAEPLVGHEPQGRDLSGATC